MRERSASWWGLCQVIQQNNRKRQGHTWKAWSNTQQTEPTEQAHAGCWHRPSIGRHQRKRTTRWVLKTQRALANSACIYISYEIQNYLPRTQLRTYDQTKHSWLYGGQTFTETNRQRLCGSERAASLPSSRVQGASLLPEPGLSCRHGFFPTVRMATPHKQAAGSLVHIF